eukprot:7545011-Ditylum_brightwellii.AAC.1
MLTGYSKGKSLILAGGFNETLNSTSGMIRFCADEKLKMVHTLWDLMNTSFSTTKSGKNRIDFILTMPELTTAIPQKGYQPFDHMIFTNHRGMFTNFDTTTPFGTGTTILASKDRWGI